MRSFDDVYHDIAVTCFRYFGFTTFDQVDQLTVRQFRIMIDALKLKNVDTDFHQHWQAYLNFAAHATKQSGKTAKPVYAKFADFYDYERELNKAMGKASPKNQRFAGLAKYLREKKEREDRNV